jgi:hypothetical protein
MPSSNIQAFISRIGALAHALDLALGRIAEISGEKAREHIEILREQAINDFRNSDIPPEREMEHAEIVRPGIEASK